MPRLSTRRVRREVQAVVSAVALAVGLAVPAAGQVNRVESAPAGQAPRLALVSLDVAHNSPTPTEQTTVVEVRNTSSTAVAELSVEQVWLSAGGTPLRRDVQKIAQPLEPGQSTTARITLTNPEVVGLGIANNKSVGTLQRVIRFASGEDPLFATLDPALRAPSPLTEWTRKQFERVIRLADDADTGRRPRNDLAIAWVGHDVFRGADGRQYVPFTVTIDPSRASAALSTGRVNVPSVQVYWRLVPRATTDAGAPSGRGRAGATEAIPPVFEASGSATLARGAPRARVVKAFDAPPGRYDLTVVVVAPQPVVVSQGRVLVNPDGTVTVVRSGPDPVASSTGASVMFDRASVIRQTIEVPDLWESELGASSIVLTERATPVAGVLLRSDQERRPYAVGGVEIQPAADAVYARQEKLQPVLVIHGARADVGGKPNVLVEYAFHRSEATGGAPFARTKPLALDGATLPTDYDLREVGHLIAAYAVPLAAFPPGSYRLEVKATDAMSGQSLTRSATFTVSP
jgi:hypothetical protein